MLVFLCSEVWHTYNHWILIIFSAGKHRAHSAHYARDAMHIPYFAHRTPQIAHFAKQIQVGPYASL